MYAKFSVIRSRACLNSTHERWTITSDFTLVWEVSLQLYIHEIWGLGFTNMHNLMSYLQVYMSRERQFPHSRLDRVLYRLIRKKTMPKFSTQISIKFIELYKYLVRCMWIWNTDLRLSLQHSTRRRWPSYSETLPDWWHRSWHNTCNSWGRE